MWEWQAVKLFWLPGIISRPISHDYFCPRSHKKILIACLSAINSSSIHASYYLCCLSFVTPDRAKNICIYGTQTNGDQWKQCTRILQRDRQQSGWEWERGWRGRVEMEPAHRLPMFGRELISTCERSGWTAPGVELKERTHSASEHNQLTPEIHETFCFNSKTVRDASYRNQGALIVLIVTMYMTFLSVFSSVENSCARTEAVFTPYPGFKSHVKGNTKQKLDMSQMSMWHLRTSLFYQL